MEPTSPAFQADSLHLSQGVHISLQTLLLTISIFDIYSDIELLNHMVILLLPWQFSWLRIPLQCKEPGFDPWGGKISWRRAWQLTLVFLPGEPPWTEEPGGLQSMGSQRAGYDLVTEQQQQIGTLHTIREKKVNTSHVI